MNIKLGLFIALVSISGSATDASQTPIRKYIANQATNAAQQRADAQQQLAEIKIKVQKASTRERIFQEIGQCVDKAHSTESSNTIDKNSPATPNNIAYDCALDTLIAHRNGYAAHTNKEWLQLEEQTIKNIMQEIYHMNSELTQDKEEHLHLEKIANKYYD